MYVSYRKHSFLLIYSTFYIGTKTVDSASSGKINFKNKCLLIGFYLFLVKKEPGKHTELKIKSAT